MVLTERVMLKRQPTASPVRRAESGILARPAVVERALDMPGHALDGVTRTRMEAQLGHHFAELAVTPSARASATAGVVAANDRTEREADAAAEKITRGAFVSDMAVNADFSRVRIHTDNAAQTSARALNALAFTVGSDIFFDAGRYAPMTSEGQALLAHELTHVLQAEHNYGGGVIQRKEASKSLPIADALQVALKGDDDDTRDLTNNPAWAELELDASQSATLVIHLLDGYTGDDDENAGLHILRKDIGAGMLDPTLMELNKRGRFGQLLDDYDGSEYRELLALLSLNISTQPIRARYLDEFISMWWVREHEERAIVLLLEKTSDSDRAFLLQPKFREEGLRDAIDTDDVSVRYEELVHAAFGERAKSVSKDKQQWTKLFDEEAKKCMRKGMGKGQKDDLLQRAVKDVENEVAQELSDYTDAILHETIRPFGDPDAGKLAEINRSFRKKMDGLLEKKRAEFCAELKWGIEFNRNLNQVSGIAWTKEDLDKMDKVLSAIPEEILHADPKLTAFLRERERPGKHWLWGETHSPSGGAEGNISLLHGIDLGVTAHELGHIIHNLDPQLLNDFQDLSGWELLDDVKIDALKKGDKKNDKNFDPLLARLEEKRKKDGDTRAECGETYTDGFFYLYNRYGDGYYRYPDKRPDGAGFVTDYAGTQPRDDFAETFSEYLVNPTKLRKKEYLKKYKFMHVEVFVKFWLRNQFHAANGEMDKIFAATYSKFPASSPYIERLKNGAVQDLWDVFYAQESDLIKVRAAEAETTKLNMPVPLKGSTDARDATKVLLTQARDLMALAEKIIKPEADLSGILMGAFLGLDASLEPAFKALSDKLTGELEGRLNDLFDPLAERIVKGEHIVKDKWQELDAITAEMEHVPDVIEGYLKIYGDLIEARKELFALVRDDLLKYPENSTERESFRTFAVERLKRFDAEKKRVETSVRAGTPFDAKAFGDPHAQMLQDKKDILAFEKTLKP